MEEKNKKRINANKLLRAARERRGWSQIALADLVGTTELTVGRWERGERTPQLVYRAKLCQLFGMTAEELGLVKKEQTDSPREGDNVAIVCGPGQPNTLVVIARGSTFALFIIGHEIDHLADPMFASGHIGIAVGDYNAATQQYTTVAAFVEQKVWKLT